MKIAVLSGKGGTGKTTVSASLALSVGNCQYADCDVEEPNGALFIEPEIKDVIPVSVTVPEADTARCSGCGACGQACRFNAIAVVKGSVLVFPEVCRHCGACAVACPEKAILEAEREVGVIEADGKGLFLQGRLNIGESVAVPVIRVLKRYLRDDIPVILDCAPGASCTVMKTIAGCDYCILVTEPTPFGLHDLRIAVELIRYTGIPFGVLVNKAMEEDKSVQNYCEREGIPVLMEIPYSRSLAEGYSNGILPVRTDEELKEKFIVMYNGIKGSRAS